MISFKDFQKISLKVARVTKAEKLEGSEKLIKLQLNLGEKEERQIIAGIAKFYQPEDLISQEIVLVENLEPKKIFGQDSRGMLLAADNKGEPVILKPEKSVPPGTKIQ